MERRLQDAQFSRSYERRLQTEQIAAPAPREGATPVNTYAPIDLRSDTVTQPSEAMRAHIARAPVGDDAYGEDASVNQLQEACKELFQKEAALFVVGGMMANRLAFMAQTRPGDEVITDYNYHVNFFDSAPMAALAGVVMNTRHTSDGILTTEEVIKAMRSKQRYDYFAQPRLISVENSINGLAGKIFPYATLKELSRFAAEEGLALHLDGARLFNAHIATGIPLQAYSSLCDTLSICFAKGLGAPYGSMLMGSEEVIARARRFRLWLGGGIHQGGFQAAAAHYALEHHIQRLEEDHQLAREFAAKISAIEGIAILNDPVETNMVQFSVVGDAFQQHCHNRGLLLFPWVPGVFRAVFHRNIQRDQIDQAVSIIEAAVHENRLLQ